VVYQASADLGTLKKSRFKRYHVNTARYIPHDDVCTAVVYWSGGRNNVYIGACTLNNGLLEHMIVGSSVRGASQVCCSVPSNLSELLRAMRADSADADANSTGRSLHHSQLVSSYHRTAAW